MSNAPKTSPEIDYTAIVPFWNGPHLVAKGDPVSMTAEQAKYYVGTHIELAKAEKSSQQSSNETVKPPKLKS